MEGKPNEKFHSSYFGIEIRTHIHNHAGKHIDIKQIDARAHSQTDGLVCSASNLTI